MASRLCNVSLTDPDGVRHTVEVSAESLMEAAALGLAALKRENRIHGPGRAARLDVTVLAPVVKHSVSVERVMKWLEA